MTEIPDGIKQAAIAAWNESTRMSIRRQGDPWEPIARALMAERLAERERCARKVSNYDFGDFRCENRGVQDWETGEVPCDMEAKCDVCECAVRQEAQSKLAAAIRGQS